MPPDPLPFLLLIRQLLATRKKLPVYQFLDELLDRVKRHQTVVVEGETGSGKTTQIPQFLVNAGYAGACPHPLPSVPPPPPPRHSLSCLYHTFRSSIALCCRGTQARKVASSAWWRARNRGAWLPCRSPVEWQRKWTCSWGSMWATPFDSKT